MKWMRGRFGQTCAPQGAPKAPPRGHGALCPCRKPGVSLPRSGNGEFVVGEKASQPPLPPPFRAVPLAQQQGAQVWFGGPG